MQAARFEGSLLASLSELKAIEQQRVADERAAVVRAEEIRIQEQADAERRSREAEAAKQRVAQETLLAVEHARADAEREARLRVEAAEAAERSRQAMALEQERQAQELALRKAEVAKKRPTWMIAVTLLALALAGVLVWFTVGSLQASAVASEAEQAAIEREKLAKEDSEKSRIELEQLAVNVEELDKKINAMITLVGEITTRAELVEANKKLKKLQAERAAAARRAEDIRIANQKKERTKIVKVCADAALCK